MKPSKMFIGLILLTLAFCAWGQTSVQAFQDDDSLEMIRQKIERNGYGFTVGHNWVFDMTPEQKQEFFSRRPSSLPRVYGNYDNIGPLADELGKTLPAAFDWRNVNGHSYIGPVRNQGGCGSCYSFGASAAAEGVYNVANGLYDAAAADFSEMFIMWCLSQIEPYKGHFNGCAGADYDYMELEALVQEGTIHESDYPYSDANANTCNHLGYPRTKFAEWHRIPCNDIDAIKTAIMTYGVIDVAVNASSAFQAYSGGIFQDTNTSCYSTPCDYTPTNHAVALVGWNDADGAWILRNSWGPAWGENGYMRIKYTSAVVACEATYLVYSVVPGVTVTAPSSASNWEAGTTQSIAWSVSGSLDANVKIELIKGGAKVSDITASAANDGSFDWALPASLAAGSDYQVRVTTADNAYSDDSDLFTVTVTTPAITVTAPAAGANWATGTLQSITWTKTGLLDANVRIELFKAGIKAMDIAATTENDGGYGWTVPSTLATASDYSVRVTSADDAAGDDSAAFSITSKPSLTVTAPGAGAVWTRGTNQNILWTKTGKQSSTVNIRLYRNGVLKMVIKNPTPNDGLFTWRVRATLGKGPGYKIRVTASGGKVDDTSDPFTIQ